GEGGRESGGRGEIVEGRGAVGGEGRIASVELAGRPGGPDRVESPDVSTHEGVTAGRGTLWTAGGHDQTPALPHHVTRLAGLRIGSARIGRLEPLRVGGVGPGRARLGCAAH